MTTVKGDVLHGISGAVNTFKWQVKPVCQRGLPLPGVVSASVAAHRLLALKESREAVECMNITSRVTGVYTSLTPTGAAMRGARQSLCRRCRRFLPLDALAFSGRLGFINRSPWDSNVSL